MCSLDDPAVLFSIFCLLAAFTVISVALLNFIKHFFGS